MNTCETLGAIKEHLETAANLVGELSPSDIVDNDDCPTENSYLYSRKMIGERTFIYNICFNGKFLPCVKEYLYCHLDNEWVKIITKNTPTTGTRIDKPGNNAIA